MPTATPTVPRKKTSTAQPSRPATVPHSGTTVRADIPATANRPTVRGAPNAKASTAASVPPPHPVTSNPKPSTGTAAVIAAQTRRR
ncbi:hypothetical protein ACWEGX_28020 [Streptomyces chartreusis]